MNRPAERPLATYLEHHGTAPSPAGHQRMRERLDHELARRAAGRTRWLHWGQAALATAAAALVLWLVWPRGTAAPAATEVATMAQVHEIALPHDGVLRVRAHTRIHLEVGEGATVTLHEGAVELDVEQAPGALWRVVAGDYTVDAIGTRFEVRKTEGAPDVRVEEGIVRVTGPDLPANGLEIAAPSERDDAPARLARATPPPSEPELPPSTEPTATTSPTEAARPKPDEPAPRTKSSGWIEGFRAAVQDGAYARAVELLPAGFPRGAAGLDPQDLVDAGDALRATGDSDRAEAAYELACRRPKHAACGVATMHRAHLRAKVGDRKAAIALASDYLRDHPQGGLARDALGRRMQWLAAEGRDAEARRDAAAYLERWPDGSWAQLARNLVDK